MIKKLLILIICSILSYNSFAATGPCAISLELWLRAQGKFAGANIRTRQIEGTNLYEIYVWDVLGVPKPTDAEVEQIIIDYPIPKPKTEKDKLLDLLKDEDIKTEIKKIK